MLSGEEVESMEKDLNLQPVIALDGPSGSGKSTVAKKLSQELGLLHVNTGAMYRGLAAFFKDQKLLTLDGTYNEESLKQALQTVQFQFAPREGVTIEINKKNYSEAIKTHEVSSLSSLVATLGFVRSFLVSYQRTLVNEKFCVMEGRDIGSVVFPKAFLKVYLDASLEVRSKRRFDELKERSPNESFELANILEDVKQRDHNDKNRKDSPLVQSEDALYLDSTDLSLDEVVELIKKWTFNKAKSLGISLNS